MKKFIVSVDGMELNKCNDLETELNSGDKRVFMVDKTVMINTVFDNEKCIISAVGMSQPEIDELTKELNDEQNTKEYHVINKLAIINYVYK